MDICIATIQNKMGSILKYRILSLDTGVLHDIHSRSIINYIKTNNIKNLALENNTVICTQGSIEDYPVIHADGKVKNNIPVVLQQDTENIKIANYEGKVLALPINVVIQKVNKFANAIIDNGKIIYKEANKKTKITSKGFLDRVLESKIGDININIQGFNMQDYYRKFGVSDDVLKKPSDVFIKSKKEDLNLENNKDAYEFEIVKIDDRVELRSYKGDKYTGIVNIPTGVTHICKSAFKEAEATELFMPETVVYIGDYAFKESKFKIVHLSSKVDRKSVV